MLQKKLREILAGKTFAMGRVFGKAASANTYTALVLLFGIGGGLLLALQYVAAAILCILLSGFFDAIDGAVAKANKKSSVFGGIFDSVTDKITETAFYAGFFFGYPGLQTASFLAAISFLLSSYTFKRILKEGKTPPGFVLLERKERIFIIIAAIALAEFYTVASYYLLLLIAAWSFYSVLQMLCAAKKIF